MVAVLPRLSAANVADAVNFARMQGCGPSAARTPLYALTPNEVMQGWLASPEHCENIMDGRFTLIGIAYAENLHSRSAVFWTQDFAAHR